MRNNYITELQGMQENTHKFLILRHLLDYGSITSFEAFTEYGITRLSAVIYNLKNDHHIDIYSGRSVSKNRYGKAIHFARYELVV